MSKVHDYVTEKIISLLEQGTIPWKQPWKGGQPTNLVSKKAYQGINSFLLGHLPFASNYWLSYKQAESLGGMVKKGSKSSMVVFWSMLESKNKTSGVLENIPFLRYYNVFNATQCEGIELPSNDTSSIPFNPIEACENVVKGMPTLPEIKHEQPRAFYSPSSDFVNMPMKESFISAEAYYQVLFHELTHATGHKDRLNRKQEKIAAFGSEEYSKEELIAEMGASFLCRETGIDAQTIEQSASYIASWLKALKNDKQMVVKAAGAAQKASNYILGKQEVNV